MLRNSILTIYNLKIRSWQLPNICLMCFEAEESVAHLFAECATTKEIQAYIHDEIQSHV
jgi:zinc-binding in reverse transcriptase